MLAYYGSRISDHMTKTPEGFLICHDVPIARTGRQDYLPQEIGQTGTELIPVYRTEEEVFSPQAMASFEGKPVTAEHPPMAVDPNNYSMFLRGHASNIRRGKGEESDLLLADLFIDDRDLIRQIDGGLREVSCGYECDYAPDAQGRIFQSRIRGNHIAVVEAGRAGPRVSIKDSAGAEPIQKKKEEKPKMTQTKKPSKLARFFSGWVRDRDPEEVATAMDELLEEQQQDQPKCDTLPPQEQPAPVAVPTPTPVEKQETDEAPANGELVMLLKQLIAKLSEPQEPEEDEDPLEQLTTELESKAPAEDEEESVTVPAEEINEDEAPAAAPDGEEKKEQPVASADSAATLAAIKAVRPYLAKLNAEDKRAASDALCAAVRDAKSKAKKQTGDGYQAIARMQALNARGKQKPVEDEAELGRRIMAARNPHYKTETVK